MTSSVFNESHLKVDVSRSGAGRTCLIFFFDPTVSTKVCCDQTRFKAKFLLRLVLNTLLTESETYNALVVMVCSGERSTQSTERITELDTAQTLRILDKACDHSTPLDSRSVSSHEKKAT